MSNRTYHPRGELVDGVAVREHPLYCTWANMLSRCTNENDGNYVRYGARGISVCERWFHFKNFVADMGPKPSPELTLERKENSLGYAPENCRWDTRTNQCVNRREFSNNTSGHTGVVKKNGTWLARFDYETIRYNIAWCATYDEAVAQREAFVELFFSDRDAAMDMLPKDKARHTSQTGVRGVSPHSDGGFIVRVTIACKRIYVGYFKTLQEACDARQNFIAKQTA